jgi:hypothetical protein
LTLAGVASVVRVTHKALVSAIDSG